MGLKDERRALCLRYQHFMERKSVMKTIATCFLLLATCLILVLALPVGAASETFKFLAIQDPTGNGGPNGE